MILSDTLIKKRIQDGDLILDPYNEASQQPASYDLRAEETTFLSHGACTLVPSLEWVELPADVAATLRCRSSFGRRGILIGGGFVDPGFRGQLTLCLVNMGAEDVVVEKEERIVQIIMQTVAGGDRLYEGRYQDSRGAVANRDSGVI